MSHTALIGPRVSLRPLAAEDAAALLAAAADGELWNLPHTVVPSAATVDAYIATALTGRDDGTVLPFATTLTANGRIVGSTRFWQIDRVNRSVEIGHTWISASWQHSFVNTEAKFLMLRYAFEQMDCVRVQLRTSEHNAASRAAITKIGAQFEGILRHECIMPDGRKRNSAIYSIIDDEWPDVRAKLQGRLDAAIDVTPGPG